MVPRLYHLYTESFSNIINNLLQLTRITQKIKPLPHGNLVCKILLIWRMLTRMTRSHCAGAAGGGQSCDPSLGAALCLHFLQTETHHSPPSPTFSPPPPKIQPLKRICAHTTAPFYPCPIPKIPRSSKNSTSPPLKNNTQGQIPNPIPKGMHLAHFHLISF